MSGLQLSLALFACLLLLFAVGLPVAAAMKLRGLWLVAAAPAASIAVIVLSAMGASALGVRWSLWQVLAVALIAAGLAWVTLRLLRTHGAARQPSRP